MSDVAVMSCANCGEGVREDKLHISAGDEVVCVKCCDCGSEPCGRNE